MTSQEAVNFSEVILTRMKVAAQHTLPKYVAEHFAAEEIASDFSDDLVYFLRSEVLGLRHDTQKAHGSLSVKFEMPATWWQHLKQQGRFVWWLRWLARWRPVRMTTHWRIGYADFDVERYRTFPDADIHLPLDKLGPEVRILIAKPMQWTLPAVNLPHVPPTEATP